ncbi:MAG: hypothetical protein LBO78_03630 [Rickettsiales bacterium]|nr:hypothetical protein [Rickettsiales bacterium]
MKRVRSKDFSEIINMLYHEIYSLRAKARLECGKCSQTADSKCIDMNFDMQKKASSIVVCPQKNYIKMLDLILTYSYKESGMEMDAYF